ncbi:hypothetical protein KCP73_00730 [Salmonella enterica subsp. enterica]|nr:hypothetical protein KCP73_00730 [Salmonella enterica subsp. enterica]
MTAPLRLLSAPVRSSAAAAVIQVIVAILPTMTTGAREMHAIDGANGKQRTSKSNLTIAQ